MNRRWFDRTVRQTCDSAARVVARRDLQDMGGGRLPRLRHHGAILAAAAAGRGRLRIAVREREQGRSEERHADG